MIKNICQVLLIALFTSCTVDEQDDHAPKKIRFPFENLDATNFNRITANLTLPNSKVRLDSVVYINYQQYNPNTGISEYQVPNFKNSPSAPPPPMPTHRRTEVFNYNENNHVVAIHYFVNSKIDDLTQKGDLESTRSFLYDTDGNLIKMGSNEEYYQEYIYSNNLLVRQNGLASNSNHHAQYEISKDKAVQKNFSKGDLSSTGTYTLDAFGNIKNIYRTWVGYDTKYNYTYMYPKNIANPFVNLFPSNFPSFVYFSDGSGGYTHYSSGITDKYNEQIQVDDNGFPEIIQSGSYDDGNRTKYYYSIIN